MKSESCLTDDWSRHHDHMASLSAMFSVGGRVFYIMDEGRREAILLPAKWVLIARDAYRGTLLWKRPIGEWNTQLWPLKSGPNQPAVGKGSSRAGDFDRVVRSTVMPRRPEGFPDGESLTAGRPYRPLQSGVR